MKNVLKKIFCSLWVIYSKCPPGSPLFLMPAVMFFFMVFLSFIISCSIISYIVIADPIVNQIALIIAFAVCVVTSFVITFYYPAMAKRLMRNEDNQQGE